MIICNMQQVHYQPGHGPPGTKADIVWQREYMTVLEELVTQVTKEGGSVEEAVQQPLPAPFDNWLTGEMTRFERNVRFLYQHLSGQ